MMVVAVSIYCWKKRNKRQERATNLDCTQQLLETLVQDAQQEIIPMNIREQTQNTIKDWRRKDKMFVDTKASDYVIECLQKNSCVTLTAPSGVGKSFICRHIALDLEKKGYTIIPVEVPTDIKTYYQPGKQTVFIVDDMCGNFTASQQQIDTWKQLLPVINTIITDTCCKIIASCRLQVYQDDKFNILSPFKSCECNLVSDELGLTSVEKTKIAKTYIGTNIKYIDDVSYNCDFFPLLCSLYNEEKYGDVKEYFKNPFDVYKSELDILCEHGDDGNYKTCSLALCVLFNNRLPEIWFQNKVKDTQRHIIEDACEACGINRSTSKTKLKKELDSLVGTYICKLNGSYSTVHDKLFDFLVHYFGQKMIECLIDHGDSRLVHERFSWKKSPDDKTSNIDFIIEIPDDYLESYFQRFIKDWSAGKVAVVFNNNNMKVSSFRQRLIQYLQQLDQQQVKLANTKDTVRPKKSPASGSTPLILICYDGYTDMVQWLLCNDVNVDQCRDDGVSGLMMASQQGYTYIVKLLLERNPDVNLCKKDGYSPLIQASYEGHTDIVQLLLERNPDVNLCDNDGRNPLIQASACGHTDIVKLLLERNSDVNLCNKDGLSPLITASACGHTDIVKLLLERNADVNLCNKNSFSPLIHASDGGHTDIVKLLLERNADVNLCNKDGWSPLLHASDGGHTDIVKLLLEMNPNVNLCNKDGTSPLVQASQNGHTVIVKLLLERNPDVNLCNKDGFSPLIKASICGHTDIVRLLLERNHVPCDNTPLSTSYVYNNISISNSPSLVQPIMKHKPDINAQTYVGGNALYFSALFEHIEITQLLLEKNADSNICIYSKQYIAEMMKNHPTGTLEKLEQNLFDTLVKSTSPRVTEYVSKKSVDYAFDVVAGSSPLHIACFMGRTDIVRSLVDYKSNINMNKEDGTTPLFYACEVGHKDIVLLLLDKGADTQICRIDDITPLGIATENKHKCVVVIVKEHMHKTKPLL
ncbi:uncharacterized protein LOC134719313 [Mytilus trossulus]|uniref:uncharacterized protein LOC134719313 n=1 Tax=Mytilus trossulus TaxID=6551 RepID=UPI003004DF26